MTTETLHTEKTTVKNENGTMYIRIPPSFIKYMKIEKNTHPINISMARGKHGKFLWIQPTEQEE